MLAKTGLWQYGHDHLESWRFSQFPLRLPWAMTIYDVLGLILDSACLDIRVIRGPGAALCGGGVGEVIGRAEFQGVVQGRACVAWGRRVLRSDAMSNHR